MNVLFIVNDAPYGTEKAYNALRMATTILKEHEGSGVWFFLMGDAVACGLPGQNTPQGYYNIEKMLKAILNRGAQVKACGSCCEARGIKSAMMAEGVEISTMSQLTQWTMDADKVLVF
jgi:uncharacterized protein involved in oxidation of intracellular sulfur